MRESEMYFRNQLWAGRIQNYPQKRRQTMMVVHGEYILFTISSYFQYLLQLATNANYSLVTQQKFPVKLNLPISVSESKIPSHIFDRRTYIKSLKAHQMLFKYRGNQPDLKLHLQPFTTFQKFKIVCFMARSGVTQQLSSLVYRKNQWEPYVTL